jgi:hypothetical protein
MRMRHLIEIPASKVPRNGGAWRPSCKTFHYICSEFFAIAAILYGCVALATLGGGKQYIKFYR